MDDSEYEEMVTHPEWDEGSAERYVRGLRDRKLRANPGERFLYSNIAYNVLGDMIAKVSGKSFETYMREQILTPAGMPDSSFLFADVPSHKLAVSHLRSPEMKVNPTYPYHRADAPASFLHSTIMDMCRWGITCLKRGSQPAQRLLSPASYDSMWTPVAQWGYARPSMYEEIGLGWTLGHYKNVRTISHGGMGFGWTDFLLILPEKNRAAAILCNEESFARTRTVHAVADTLIDQKPQANTVSWMVPISRALAEGGIQAAYARYEEIRSSGVDEYYINEEDLVNFAMQLVSAKKLDVAIDVLDLNIHVYPGYLDSYLERAKISLQEGETLQAEDSLLKALTIEPDNAAASRILEMLHEHRQLG